MIIDQAYYINAHAALSYTRTISVPVLFHGLLPILFKTNFTPVAQFHKFSGIN